MNRLAHPDRACNSLIVGAFIVVSALIASALQHVGNMLHNYKDDLTTQRCMTRCLIDDTQCVNKCQLSSCKYF
jgi:hypothetical protein